MPLLGAPMDKSLSNVNQFTSLRGTVLKQVEMSQNKIDFLKSLDTEEFYNKEEDEVLRYAHAAVQELISLGNQATPALVELLQTEFTWSCFFALTIFRKTKDPLAVPGLIAFLKRETDDSMANEEAMFALQDIGDPSIPLLIEDLQEEFDNKKYNSYLVGGLTGIIGPESYEFMVKITKDFIDKPWRYKGWFHIEDFTYNFVKQGRSDAIPLLRQIPEMKGITGSEKHELEETIRALEDPAGYEKEIEETEEEILNAAQPTDG
jgi:HEAT repeat protein